MNPESLGKLFLLIGAILLVLGGILVLMKNVPFLGKLPGDILIERKNFTFYFPLSTSIVISVVISIIIYFISRR